MIRLPAEVAEGNRDGWGGSLKRRVASHCQWQPRSLWDADFIKLGDRSLRNKRQEMTNHAEYHGITQNNIQSKEGRFSLGKAMGNHLLRERASCSESLEIAHGNKTSDLPHNEHWAKQ